MRPAASRVVPYRDQRPALRFLLSRLHEERARIDEEIDGAKRQLKELRPRARIRWWRLLSPASLGCVLGVLCLAVFIVIYADLQSARDACARCDLATIQSATERSALSGRKGCTSVGRLIVEGYLDEGKTQNDPWGTPYRIGCDGDEARISSAGPDGEHGTEDDLFGR